MQKKIVYYDSTKYVNILVGFGAIVKPVNHPDALRVSNTSLVTTSKVLSYNPDSGEFESHHSHQVLAVVQ